MSNVNTREGYSLRKGRLIDFLKKSKFTLEDIATKIGISERELQERLDDWDYWSAEEIGLIVDFVGAKWALKILYLSPQERKRLQKKVFGRNKWRKRKD